MLTRSAGVDHIARPAGGGRDLQETRVRLTLTSQWDITTQTRVFLRQPGGATEWSTYAAIYDQFKVNGMRVATAFPTDGVIADASQSNQFFSYPAAVLFAYDNDSITAPSGLNTTWGYSTVAEERPMGLGSYSVPTLPLGAVYGDTTGYINSAEWTDVATPGALAGCAWGQLDQAATCTTSHYPITCFQEWDVTYRGKRN